MKANISRNCKLMASGLSLLMLLTVSNQKAAYSQTRTNYFLPNIPGYITLKGDFHIHTPFSDGSVWPSDRVKEAWRDGLDILALTDHIEYQANKTDISNDLNRPYEIAKAAADELGIILIKGAEITRSMPPGHFNAYFLSDINALKNKSVTEVFAAAAAQGAYFEWNHPGWKAQQPDTTIWFPMHTELYNKGYLNGIEVFNEQEYYPVVFQWAIDKNLSIFANSDSHGPIDFQYSLSKGEHRPMTLIFASERSENAVREAMEQHRTAVLFRDTVLGNEKYLNPMISACLKIEKTNQHSTDKINFLLTNVSDLPLTLEPIKSENFQTSSTLYIPARSSLIFTVKNLNHLQTAYNILNFRFKVLNVLKAPDVPVEISLNAEIFFWNQILFEITDEKKVKIKMDNLPDSVQFFFTTDGSNPNRQSHKVGEYFDFQDSIRLKIAAFTQKANPVSVFDEKIKMHYLLSKKLILKKEPNPKYSAGGAQSLTNGICGSTDYTDGKWLGFESDDLECIIELEKSTDIRKINIGFLEFTKSWIFLPTEVLVYVSEDGINYTEFGKMKTENIQKESNRGRVEMQLRGNSKKVQYIKVVAKNQKLCPAWHSGAGKACWLFLDEIMVQ